MKKLILGLLIGLSVFTLTGCGKMKTYEKISYENVVNKMNNKETFILYIGSSSCGACESFEPILERVIEEYQIKIDYLDVMDLSDDELNKFETIINFGGTTPKVYFIKDGEYSQHNAIKGTQDYDYVIEKMKQNGYIEK